MEQYISKTEIIFDVFTAIQYTIKTIAELEKINKAENNIQQRNKRCNLCMVKKK